MYNEVCNLVKVTTSVNDLGDKVQSEINRQVFCRVKSASYKDKEQGQANGYVPVYKIILADYLDYQGEEYVDYADRWGVSQRYRVTDKYMSDSNNELELTISRGIE